VEPADPARKAELEALCGACGLCCDGSLFGRVGLDPGELEGALRARLPVVQNGRSFEQPCPALKRAGDDSTRVCSIYHERPAACRRFVCRLYDRHDRQGGPLEARVASVRRVRELLAAVEGAGAPAGIETSTLREVARHLEADFARA